MNIGSKFESFSTNKPIDVLAIIVGVFVSMNIALLSNLMKMNVPIIMFGVPIAREE